MESTFESSAKICAFGLTTGISDLLATRTVKRSNDPQRVSGGKYTVKSLGGRFRALSSHLIRTRATGSVRPEGDDEAIANQLGPGQ
jgi:hypothetical protein